MVDVGEGGGGLERGRGLRVAARALVGGSSAGRARARGFRSCPSLRAPGSPGTGNSKGKQCGASRPPKCPPLARQDGLCCPRQHLGKDPSHSWPRGSGTEMWPRWGRTQDNAHGGGHRSSHTPSQGRDPTRSWISGPRRLTPPLPCAQNPHLSRRGLWALPAPARIHS